MIVGCRYEDSWPTTAVLELHHYWQRKSRWVTRHCIGDSAGDSRLLAPVFVIELDVPIEACLLHLYPNTPAVVVRLLVEWELEEAADKEASVELAEITVEFCLIGPLVLRDGPDHVRELPAMIGGQAIMRVTTS